MKNDFTILKGYVDQTVGSTVEDHVNKVLKLAQEVKDNYESNKADYDKLISFMINSKFVNEDASEIGKFIDANYFIPAIISGSDSSTNITLRLQTDDLYWRADNKEIDETITIRMRCNITEYGVQAMLKRVLESQGYQYLYIDLRTIAEKGKDIYVLHYELDEEAIYEIREYNDHVYHIEHEDSKFSDLLFNQAKEKDLGNFIERKWRV